MRDKAGTSGPDTAGYDVIVIGGGPGGLAAALSAKANGADRVLIVERDVELGGILNQCIHNGFGLHYFNEELTGPEYAERFIRQVRGSGIEVFLNTMVLDISPDRKVSLMSPETGYKVLSASAVILATGCRERTRGAIGIPGDRPAGVLTAGTAQRLMNMEGWLPGRRVVILGSGDIGLIMARRMTLEGARVEVCLEVMPYSGGLARNIVQCLDDYGIPLLLKHTVTAVHGKERVEKVTVARVDGNRRPVPETERDIPCDTLLLSVGLIPENELSRMAGIVIDSATGGPVVDENMETSVPGIFACGNALHVHDLADYVTLESQRAGASAAKLRQPADPGITRIQAGEGIAYTVPQKIRDGQKQIDVFFRAVRPCGAGAVVVRDSSKRLASFQRQRLSPGEMQKITLTPAALAQAAGNVITVQFEESSDA